MNQDTLRRQQLQFAHHLRDPDHAPPPPGIEARRLALYRELVLGNLQRMLDAAFPVCRTLLGENAWQARVRHFHARHRCQSPLFARIPAEFVAYLQTPQAEAPAWLVELAHYEAVELTLQTADDPAPAHLAEGDLHTGTPVLSPWLRALAYRWPVHRLGGDRLPEDTPPRGRPVHPTDRLRLWQLRLRGRSRHDLHRGVEHPNSSVQSLKMRTIEITFEHSVSLLRAEGEPS